MGGLDDEEYAREDAARAEEEWGPEFERRAEHDAMSGGRREMATRDTGDITAGELLELLADDEMIESGYDRDGMVALLLLARAGLQVLCQQIDGLQQELAELRRLRKPLTMFGVWAHGGDDPKPSRVCLTDDGDGVDHQIDVTPLLDEVLRRQARKWCRAAEDSEGPALEQLLAMAEGLPEYHELIVTIMADGAYNAGWWDKDDRQQAGAIQSTYQAAIRAATCELLVDTWRRWEQTDPDHCGERADTEAALIDAVKELRGTKGDDDHDDE
jgi:hypothetical protein